MTGPPWVSLWPTNDHADCSKDARHIGIRMDTYLLDPNGVTKIAPATFCPDCYAQHKSTTNAEEAP
ncbi:hypothetical protein FK530_23040 [Tsukamurella conjunctivitidis]|uniref:Uncharacterized protein n=1 Tax=Tsukamurella conjunctivitidis TaxID=2592068 RepID=A0A5C5RSS8_9ACTN|nr:hypothetical protein [Tsukamurella conjunctivitidis]TWS25598.1 hypothetical protein FK530_23040 [Tsukamurella conjunctivitidis]